VDLELKDKIALVTGGASGIGRATAARLTGEGARVVILDKDAGAAEGTARELGENATGFGLDVTRYQDVMRLMGDVHRRFGRIDCLVNAAGALAGGNFVDSTPDAWGPQIQVCLFGVLHCCRAVLPIMAGQNGGRIVNIASEAARVGEKQMAVYSAAKGGIVAFSKSIAKEHGRHWINVNVVCPGTTKTQMTSFLTPELEAKWVKSYPLRRLGQPEDIADPIVFLLSDRASWITGQTISVSGGYSMC
jgi:2-hydroxycyclohexanecarboxyl-CoA dehydrogenase